MATAAEVSELRLVLLGNNWILKAAVKNLLLGEKEFIQHDKCVKGSGKDKPVSVIFTPDKLLTSTSQEEHEQFIKDIKDLSSPGPHVFLLVLQPEDFSKQHKTRLESVLESFSEQAFDRSLVLMSMPRAVTQGSVNKYLIETHMMAMISRCRYRYVWMDTTDLDLNLGNVKRRELFSRISNMLKMDYREHLNPDHSEEKDTGEQRPKTLRITLVGKTGTGKSSSGNTILGRGDFFTKLSQRSVTRECQKEEAVVDGRHVSVVDTPGLFDTTTSCEEGNEEKLRSINLLEPGPHVFLLVLQIGRLTPEDKDALELIKQGFGKEVDKFTIVLLTHGDKLEKENTTAEEYIEEYKPFIKEPFPNTADRNRFHVFNNNKREDRSQVKELMKKIDAMVKENGGQCYTNDMLLEAEGDVKRV